MHKVIFFTHKKVLERDDKIVRRRETSYLVEFVYNKVHKHSPNV